MKRYLGTFIFLAVCFGVTVFIRQETAVLHKQWEAEQRKIDEARLTPTHTSSANILEFMGAGFKPLVADFYWIQANTLRSDEFFELQKEFAAKGMPRILADAEIPHTKKDSIELYELLSNAALFDPSFEYIYFSGAHLLAFNGQPDLAISLLNYGMKYNPKSGMIPATLAFVYYYFLGDWKQGAYYAKISFENSGKYASMYKEVATLYAGAEEYEIAIKFLQDVLDSTNDPATREQIEQQIKYLYVERHIQFLQMAVDTYYKKYGIIAVGPRELVSNGLINMVPTEPFGGEYIINAQGKVENKPYNRFKHYGNLKQYIPDGGVKTLGDEKQFQHVDD